MADKKKLQEKMTVFFKSSLFRYGLLIACYLLEYIFFAEIIKETPYK